VKRKIGKKNKKKRKEFSRKIAIILF